MKPKIFRPIGRPKIVGATPQKMLHVAIPETLHVKLVQRAAADRRAVAALARIILEDALK